MPFKLAEHEANFVQMTLFVFEYLLRSPDISYWIKRRAFGITAMKAVLGGRPQAIGRSSALTAFNQSTPRRGPPSRVRGIRLRPSQPGFGGRYPQSEGSEAARRSCRQLAVCRAGQNAYHHGGGPKLRDVRNLADLAMLVGCGLRRAEIVTVKVEDLELREDHCGGPRRQGWSHTHRTSTEMGQGGCGRLDQLSEPAERDSLSRGLARPARSGVLDSPLK